ncbi:MAG: glycosyltransferase family 39 protein [Patescibacteria group bacterium]
MVANFFKKNLSSITLVLLIVIGLLLRIYFLIHRGSFWFDELFSVHFANLSVGQIWYYLVGENNPPFYILLFHFFGKIVPLTEYSTRCLSLLFNILALFFLYLLGKKMFNRRVALIAVLFSSLSLIQIVYAVEARVYSLLFLLAILSTYFYWDFFGPKISRRSFGLYFIFSILLIWCHLFSWFVILAQAVVIIWQRRQARIKHFFLAQAVILGSFLFWFIPALYRKLQVPLLEGWFFKMPVYIFNGFKNISYFLAAVDSHIIAAFIYLFIFACLLAVIWYGHKKDDHLTRIKIIYCFILILPPFLIVFMHAKYFLGCSLGFYLLIAKGFDNLTLRSREKVLALVGISIFLILLNLSFVNQFHFYWQEIGGYLNNNQVGVDKIIVSRYNHALLVDKYYQGGVPVAGFLPVAEKSDDDDLNLVKYNWVNYLKKENIGQLADIIEDDDKIILIEQELIADVRDLVLEWFAANNWQIVGQLSIKANETPEVFILQRINN